MWPLAAAALFAAATACAGEPPWAGIPLADLPALHLGEPHLDLLRSGWQAALPNGFVRVSIGADEAEATAVFASEALTAATVALPSLAVAGADEARGDAAELVLLRSRNVVAVIRDRDGAAAQVAASLLGALVVDAPVGPARVRVVDGAAVAWDTCGRRTVGAP